MVLLLEGTPQILEEFRTAARRMPGTSSMRGAAILRPAGWAVTISEGERVPVGDVQHRRVQFSYRDGRDFVFFDVESFDELILSAERIGERHWFIKENVEYRALLLEGRLLDIVMPPAAALEIVDTTPPVRGGSDATGKPAKLDTGLEIMVQLFIAPGEKVRVDTATHKYTGHESVRRNQGADSLVRESPQEEAIPGPGGPRSCQAAALAAAKSLRRWDIDLKNS